MEVCEIDYGSSVTVLDASTMPFAFACNMAKKSTEINIVLMGKNLYPAYSSIADNYLNVHIQEHGLNAHSQYLPPLYLANGSFYLISLKELRACRSFVPAKTFPFLIESPKEFVDKDSEWDFKLAEFILANCNKPG